MIRLNPLRFNLVLLAVVGVACDDSSTGSTAVSASGTVTEVLPGSSVQGDPVVGVQVCQYLSNGLSNNCTTTDDSGSYTLRVLKETDVAIAYIKEGFGQVLVATQVGVVDFTLDAGLAKNDALANFFSMIDSAYPPTTTGYLTTAAFRNATPLAGISYALTRSNGTSFYIDDAGLPDTSLEATQIPGIGGFVEVAPVDVRVSVSGGVNCSSDTSWPARATNAFDLPIREGFWTQSRVACE